MQPCVKFGILSVMLVSSGSMLAPHVATADQHADQLAAFGIEYALTMLQTDSTTIADKETPVDLITAKTLTGG